MADSVPLTITAFVIALVALFVSFAQMAQSFLGTAEGYRRCKQSVIGPWAVRTHRHWIWSEFRFETRYTTPQILLHHDEELQRIKEKLEQAKSLPHGWAQRLPVPLVSQRPEPLFELDRTIHPPRTGENGLDNELLVTWISFLQELHDVYGTYQPDACSGHYISHFPFDFTIQHWRFKYRNLLARLEWWTYPSLFHRHRRLNTRAIQHQGQYCCEYAGRTQYDERTAVFEEKVGQVGELRGSMKAQDWNSSMAVYPADCQHKMPTFLESDPANMRTHATVTYRELSWDFMPPEVVRPLATSTVGNIVVLAIRLGMDWRELKTIDQGAFMRADGNGMSVSSEPIRGLGIVLRFQQDPTVKQPSHRQYLNTIYADKMICGLLPTCRELVRPDKDIQMTVADKGIGYANMHNFLEFLSLRDALRDGSNYRADAIGEAPRKVSDTAFFPPPYNECIAILAPFMPHPKSHLTLINFHGWHRGNRDSTFQQSGGRAGYLRHIRKLYAGRSALEEPSFSTPSHLHWVSNTMEYLATECEMLFKNYHTRSPVTGRIEIPDRAKSILHTSMERQNPTLLINDLRKIHAMTTRYFQYLCSRDEGIKFQDLAAAHLVRGWKAARRADEKLKNKSVKEKEQIVKTIREECGRPLDRPDPILGVGWFGVFLLVDEYCSKQGMQDFLDELVEYRQCTISESDAQDAWWTLVLRGICWEMSVWVDIHMNNIPASFYGHKAPVWIT